MENQLLRQMIKTDPNRLHQQSKVNQDHHHLQLERMENQLLHLMIKMDLNLHHIQQELMGSQLHQQQSLVNQDPHFHQLS